MFPLVPCQNPIDNNKQRINKMDRKTAEHVFNYRGTDFPVSAKDYHKIEEQNPRGGGHVGIFWVGMCRPGL